MSRFRSLVDRLAIGQNRRVQARMALGRRDELNGAMAMVVVVPIGKPRDPLTRFTDAGERLPGVFRPILQRLE